MIARAAVVLAVAAAALAGPADPPATADCAVAVFPYRHVSVVPGEQLLPTPASDGTLWVTVDDGSAVPRYRHSRAIPADGAVSHDAASADPSRCDTEGGVRTVCWRTWQRVGQEVRIWTLFRGQSCVLIASLSPGEPTRVNCTGGAGDRTGPDVTAPGPELPAAVPDQNPTWLT